MTSEAKRVFATLSKYDQEWFRKLFHLYSPMTLPKFTPAVFARFKELDALYRQASDNWNDEIENAALIMESDGSPIVEELCKVPGAVR